MQRESFHAIVTVSCVVMVCLAMITWTATPAMAEVNNWDGVGDWTDDAASYWSTGTAPTSGNLVNLRSGTVSINNEAVAAQYLWFGHDFEDGTAADMTLNMSGGSLTTSLDAAFLGLHSPTMTWNLSGGTVDVGRSLYMLLDNEESGDNSSATLNMTGGELNIAGNLTFGDTRYTTTKAAITRTAHVQLDGGTLSASYIGAAVGGDYGGGRAGGGTLSMDITGGTLILDHKVTSMGFVTAYGGTGSFVYDYDGEVPGKTVITATTDPPPPPPEVIPTQPRTLRTTVGDPTTLTTWPTQINTDSVTCSRTSHVAVFYPQGELRKMRVSTDAGLTWGPEMYAPNHGGGAQEIGLRDGGVLKLRSDVLPIAGRPGYYDVVTFKLPDDFASSDGVTADYEQFTAEMYIPDHVQTTDVAHPGLSKGPIIQIPDGDYGDLPIESGDLLMPMIGGFPGYNPHLDSSYLARSTDDGLTWSFYSSIAYEAVDPNPELPGHYLGPSEPSVALLPNGQMLAIMRTQHDVDGPWRPLYVAWSDDMGLTWTTPVPAEVDPAEEHQYLYNISPTVQVLDNGVVAVSYGRPGFHVAFSTDNGHTWGDLIHFSECPTVSDDPTERLITGQFDMVKVGPNSLVAVGSDHVGHLKVWPIRVDLAGDVNGDGWVGGDDLTIILEYWGQSVTGRGQGDLNGDFFVGGDDYSEVLTYWGTGIPPQSVVTGTPEPATLGLLLLGCSALPRRRKWT